MSKEILVYADWSGMKGPQKVGLLRANEIRGHEVFSFSYDKRWLTSDFIQQFDPQLKLFVGEQYNDDSLNFRSFLDSCPDRWGRLLMQRREAALAYQQERRPVRLNESDYLLGVHDHYRMGGLRFKLAPNGPFLDNNDKKSAPPISTLRELEHAVTQIETNPDLDNPDYLKWLFMLVSPGSSLGGARPKSCVQDGGSLWLAKFPSRYDDYDIAAWEYLVYILAVEAKIEMAPCRIQKFSSRHHTFLTKRFDRCEKKRIHFSSAMTQLGYDDGDEGTSYLELAQFIMANGANSKKDLEQLWRRIVFNIAVSNTDDHLRNHGFLLSTSLGDRSNQTSGWLLSPAYDINPMPNSIGLHLNINEIDNRLDYSLALEVAPNFHLNNKESLKILNEVQQSVKKWPSIAKQLAISKAEQTMMASAFNL